MRTFVLTSDKYRHCLPAFAYLFNKTLGAQFPVVVVCYDKPEAELPENFTVHSLGAQRDYSFSGGLRAFLESVHDDVFLLMLEDYFLTDASELALRSLYDFMVARREVGRIDLTLDLRNRAHFPWRERVNGGQELVTAADDALYQFSLQASLWRRAFLLRFLNDGEDPWRCEKNASKRIVAARAAGEDVPLVLGVRVPALTYVNAVGGQGKKPGAWDRAKFPAALWERLQTRGLL